MKFASLDGNMSLADQESAIRFVEAKGFAIIDIKKSVDGSMTNIVKFKRLPIGITLSDICLFLTPTDHRLSIWWGDMYVGGVETYVEANR